ncbi:hypothetical protein AAG747_05635 [Rapidithrix thailandica]|uniref:Uncharacterized protein n=1 Tax=Rapidithrix thailandica TaxID=413964 RepID=A0AAW9RR57_9BACT
MKIDINKIIDTGKVFELSKKSSIEEFYQKHKLIEKRNSYDDGSFYSVLLGWNEFFFENDKLTSVNIDISNTKIVFTNSKNTIKYNSKLNKVISYLNLTNKEWAFYSPYCFTHQLCIKSNNVYFFFMNSDEKRMRLNKIKISWDDL